MILCPIGGSASSVADSRPAFNTTRRKRVCVSCRHRWFTIEVSAELAKTMATVLSAQHMLQNNPIPVDELASLRAVMRHKDEG